MDKCAGSESGFVLPIRAGVGEDPFEGWIDRGGPCGLRVLFVLFVLPRFRRRSGRWSWWMPPRVMPRA